jgi:hypothetical protein
MTKSEAKPTISAINELFAKSPEGLREIVRGDAGDAGSGDDRCSRGRKGRAHGRPARLPIRLLHADADHPGDQARAARAAGWESVIIYFGLTGLVPLVERAHAAERMCERTMGDFNRDWAYACAHPECPFEGDPIEFYRGLTAELDSAIESR